MAAATCGVNPTKVSVAFCSELPVLPATGRPSRTPATPGATRANNLLANFDANKYDDLRYDINLQCQRVARKLQAVAQAGLLAQRGRNILRRSVLAYRITLIHVGLQCC